MKNTGAGIGFYVRNKGYYMLFSYDSIQYAISSDIFGEGINEFIVLF